MSLSESAPYSASSSESAALSESASKTSSSSSTFDSAEASVLTSVNEVAGYGVAGAAASGLAAKTVVGYTGADLVASGFA